MIRELIDQIELQKLAEQDPDALYDEMMKRAFFDELALIEKEAAVDPRAALKWAVGKVTRRGAQVAQKAERASPPRQSWTANLQPTPQPSGLTRADRAASAANVSGSQSRRAWELSPVVGPKPAVHRL